MSGMLFNVEEFHKLSCTQQFQGLFQSKVRIKEEIWQQDVNEWKDANIDCKQVKT